MRSARILPVLARAATLAGCGSGSTSPHVSASKNQQRQLAAGERYVAMGDSYTAAPYTGPTVDQACIRSLTNYPHQVAAKLGLKLTDVSCGGATTASITGSQKTASGATKPPQIDALTPATALVTISIGGNDGGVFGAASSLCVALAARAGSVPTTKPCTDLDAIAHRKGDGTIDRIAAMQKNLVKVLRAVVVRAPDARIVVVGYPDTMPAHTCSEYPLAEGDGAWATRVNKELVAAQRHAAMTVGAEFVDMYAASAGHDICSSDPWEAGQQPTAAAAPFHPYPVEQAQVAAAVERLLAIG